jgi:hypothetical protein
MEVDLRMEEVAGEGIDPERGQAPRRTMSMQRDLRMAREGIDPKRPKAVEGGETAKRSQPYPRTTTAALLGGR